ncbi:MAG: hypothetical protein RR603_07625, partial [Kurthia sp.]
MMQQQIRLLLLSLYMMEDTMKKITIQEMPQHVGETVKIGAWLANKRSSGKIAFLQLRDGS